MKYLNAQYKWPIFSGESYFVSFGLLIITLIFFALFAYSQMSWVRFTYSNSPMFDSAHHAVEEVIETHLYLEEWLAGDDLVTVESIRLHMTKSITAVDGALNGMSHDSGYPGIAPTDDELLKSLRRFKAILIQIQASMEQRIANPEQRGIGSKEDEIFDALYNKALQEEGNVDKALHRLESENLNLQNRLFYTLVALGLISSLIVGLLLIMRGKSRRKVEAALEKSRASLDFAQSISHVGSWEWNIKTGELAWSDEIYRIFGLELQEFTPTYDTFMNSVHHDDRDRVAAAVTEAVEENKPYEIEHRVVRPLGEVRNVIEKGEVFYDENNIPIRLIGAIHDITESIKADQAQKEIAEFKERIFAKSTIGMAIYDETGKCQTVNESYTKIIGATKENALAQNYHEIESWKKSGLFKKATIAVSEYHNQRHELTIKTTFGKDVALDCHLIPITSGGWTHLLVLISDITERKNAEKNLLDRTNLIQLLKSVALATNEALTMDDAMEICLEKVCAYTGWPVGHVYIKDSSGELLPTEIWWKSSPNKLQEFFDVTKSTTFSSGVGLPGKVLQDGRPRWITNVTEDEAFLRAEVADRVGIKGAFAFPVLEGKEVVAVLEFFSEEAVEPDSLILEAITTLATQLGRVTERKKVEEALSVKTNDLNEAQHLAKVGNWVLYPDSGKVEGSDELLKIFGISGDELSLEAFTGAVHPEDLEYDMITIQRGIEHGEPWNIEHRLLIKDNTVKWVEASGRPLTDEKGKTVRILGTVQDITERKMAESTLKESERRFRNTLENVKLLAVELDDKGNVSFANDFLLELTGWSREEIQNKSWFDHFVIPDQRDVIKKVFAEFIERKGEIHLHLRNRSADPSRPAGYDGALTL